MSLLPKRQAIIVFLVFAFAYFLSALVRAITATLSPTFTREFGLNAGDLGLLAGGYFFGFAAMQWPMGHWLDCHGPKKAELGLLLLAVLGCAGFAWADSFLGLLAARVVIGMGVSACLMAPLTAYRRWYSPASQLRANSWMLMTGSLGMVAATLPVQWVMPLTGWRILFIALALLLALAMVLIALQVPRLQLHPPGETPTQASAVAPPSPSGYAAIWRDPYFRALAPMGFFVYGGLVAMQTLWAAPWMMQVAGRDAMQVATGLFQINLSMLLAFWLWGLLSPRLARRGVSANRLMRNGLPLSFLLLALIIIAGDAIGDWAGVVWALYCVACTIVSLAQPAVAMAFPQAMAGRALSAFNLLIFSGVFAVQWGVGLAIDGFLSLGLTLQQAFQSAMTVFLLCTVLSWAHFLSAKSHNQS